MKQITRISPCVLTGYGEHNKPLYGYNEEIIVGADALRFRNGIADLSCLMGFKTKTGESAITGQVVIGQYNKVKDDSVFIIGNGSNETNRSNIVEVTNTTFLVKKDLNVEGNTTLNNLTIIGNANLQGTLNTNKLTVKTDGQVSGNLTVTGIIKGTMQNSSGVSYVIATTLDNYYKKTETFTRAEILGLNNLTNYYTKSELDTTLANKMNAKPDSIELYGNAPFIDFHFQSSASDYTSRIIEKKAGALQINGVICDNSTEFNKSEGATGVISSLRSCAEEMKLDRLTTFTQADNISTLCGFYPDLSNTYNLGKSDKRWGYIYLNSNPNVSSDRNLKKEIKSLNIEKYKAMYLSLKPCSYLFKDDKENQTHFGFIAQEVEESCNLLNEDKQYALYSKDKKTGEYGMSYSEMIALNTCMIQHILLENENLKKEIQKLKGNS